MVDPAFLCPGCMERSEGNANCPSCGYGPHVERTPIALPERAILNQRFYLGRLLGKPGGHGITYLAWDMKLETTAAIKEYLPQRLATRLPGDSTVTPHTSEEGRFYADGMAEFLREARTLVRFSHPNIVRVRDFFEENGSAYLVMDYYQGLSLAEYLQSRPALLAEDEAIALMQPVLAGLETVHASGYLHRDIKPANIYLAAGTTPILLDFGAARQSLGEETESLSVVLTPGYAPFEQYFRKGRQGPWTDIYSCAATLYYMMSGIRPPPALDRQTEDELEALAAVNTGVSNAVSNAVMQGLALDPDLRPASAGAFSERLEKALAGSGDPRSAPATIAAGSIVDTTEAERGRRAALPAILAVILALLAAGALFQGWRGGSEQDVAPANGTAPAPTLPVVVDDAPAVAEPVPSAPSVTVDPAAATRAVAQEQPAFESSAPGRAGTGLPAPELSAPGQSTPGQSAPGQSTPGQSTPGQSAPRSSTLESSATGPWPPGSSSSTAALRTVPTPAPPSRAESAQPLETSPPAALEETVPASPRDPGTVTFHGPGPRPGSEPGRGPPPGALQACADASPGAQCSVDTPRGNERGRCREVPSGGLACVPDHHRPGGRRPPPPG